MPAEVSTPNSAAVKSDGFRFALPILL